MNRKLVYTLVLSVIIVALLIYILQFLQMIYFNHNHVISNNQLMNKNNLIVNNKQIKRKRNKGGYFKCNRYTHNWKELEGIPKTPFGTCYIENICLDKKGEWIFYKEKDTIFSEYWWNKLNGKVWSYIQGRLETDRGNFKIHLREGTLNYNEKENNLFVTKDNKIESIKISNNFKYYDSPSFILYRYAAGNVGHVFTENINAIITLMMNFNDVTTDNHIIFMEDEYDSTKPHHFMVHYNYSLDLTSKHSREWFQIISDNPVQQLCHDEHGYKLVNSPCRNRQVKITTNDELEACFSRLYFGISSSALVYPWGREMVYPIFRNLIWSRHGYPLQEDLIEKKKIVVALHAKPITSKIGMIIWNIKEIYEYILKKLPNESFIKHLISKYDKKLEIKFLELEKLRPEEQLKEFYQVDTYLVDHGSASYYSLLMHDESMALVSPRCFVEKNKKKCDIGLIRVTATFTTSQVLPYIDLLEKPDSMDCNNRPLALNPINCDPILDKDVVYRALVAHLKSKYRNLL